jgi:hypothetical protein
MEFKHLMSDLPLHLAGCFWSTRETSMSTSKIDDEYKNYILSILKMFFRNFNAIYIMILQICTIFVKICIRHIHLRFKGLFENTFQEGMIKG